MTRLIPHVAPVWVALLATGCSGPDAPLPAFDAGTNPGVDASAYVDGSSIADGSTSDAGIEGDAGLPSTTYFPPITGDVWETIDPALAGWDPARLEDALAYAESKSSTAVMILYRGRILAERYWRGWDLHSSEAIFSASKSVTSILIGLLLQDGRLGLDDAVSQHLGAGWTQAPAEKEALITIRHLLTMTSGLTESLGYDADAGTTWYYNTSAYHELFGVIAAASGMTRDDFANVRLHDAIGMQDSTWSPNRLVASARDMARFGLLILEGGTWEGTPILSHPTYLAEALATSQDLNHAYGYLWWLNGQDSFSLPGPNPRIEAGPLMPDAPADLVGALGAGDKKIYVVKSMELVVVRHGGPTGEPTLAASGFDNVFWQMLVAAAP